MTAGATSTTHATSTTKGCGTARTRAMRRPGAARGWSELSLGARALLLAVMACGVGAVLLQALKLDTAAIDGAALLLILLALGTGTVTMGLPFTRASFSLDTVFVLGLLLVGQTSAAVIVSGLGMAIGELRSGDHDRPWHTVPFNLAAGALAASGGAALMVAVASALPATGMMGAVAGAAAGYFVANVAAVTLAVSLTRGLPLMAVLRQLTWTAPAFVAAGALAGMIALAMELAPAIGLLATPLLVVIYATIHAYRERAVAREQHERDIELMYTPTVAAITAAIEARSAVDSGHHQRVQTLALALAGELGIDDPVTLKAVRFGALMHDVGRIALPDAVLLKGEALTPAERRLVEQHPALGAELIRHIPFEAPVADTILYHHERFDGGGYPEGLAGELIPLPARLTAVAEAFDSMVSASSYQRSRSPREALAEVRRCAGDQFDPDVALVLGPALRRLGWLDASASGKAGGALASIAEGAVARAVQRNLATELEGAGSLGEALAIAARVAGPVLDADGWAALVPATAQEPPTWSAVGPGMDFVVDGAGLPRRVDVPGTVGRVESMWAGPRGDRQRVLLLPMKAAGDWSATLMVRCRDAAEVLPGGELLEAVRETMASHIARLWRARAAERLATTDALTGLRNRLAMDRALEQAAATAAATAAAGGARNTPLGLMLLDLDGFKGINDHFGHHIGDEALVLVGRALADLEHELGVVPFRNGGDEFVVTIEPADDETLAAAAVAITERLERIELQVAPGEFLTLKTSIGPVLADWAGATVEAEMERADHTMYIAKQARTDRLPRGARPVTYRKDGGDTAAA